MIMSLLIHSVLFIFRTTVLTAAILFSVKWEKEKKRADQLQQQLDEAQNKLAEAEGLLASDTEETEDQPLDYEQRTSQQRYLLLQFFWATAKRMFKDKEYPFPERESEIVYRVLIGQRLKQIGEEMDLSEGRVREIWHKALFRWSNYQTLLQQREDEIVGLKEEINRLKAQLGKAVDQDLLATRLGDLDLSVRALNSLKEAEIETVADLVRLQKTDLLKYKNFSKRAIVELSEWLEQHGLSFGMNV
jgi:hypothetical protein